LGIGKKRGGSTITQQLIKNSLLTSERTYSRKIKEIVLALKIENNFTKDEILEMYLNRIPFGGTAYGVEKAAEVFFGKDAKDLTLEEASILASLPKAPTYYSPFGNHKNTKLTKEFTLEELQKREVDKFSDILNNEYSYGLIGSNVSLPNGKNIYLPGRTDEVLKRMSDLDFITTEERQLALNQLQNIEFKKYVSNIKAPHFVFYVKELLEKKYGQDVVETGGLQVYTTLDMKQQKVAELAISKQSVINKGLGADNAASISIDAKTGQIISMVGSKDYFNNEIDGSVNIVTSRRQPGSSYKPIVYASAFSKGLNPSNYIFDVPMKLGNNTPKNFDGEFMGPIPVKNALALSRNIPAIKAYFIGGEQDEIINLSERLGIRSLDRRSDYGWPLSLGTGELQMIELAQAYSVFANQGKKVSLNPILKITDKKGKTLEDYSDSKPTQVEILSEEVAYLVNSSLSDDNVKLGKKMSLEDGRQVAAKTGTSTKKIGEVVYPSNLWTAGWSRDFVTIAWAGNSDGSKMNLNATGYGGATPIWNEIMNELHKDLEKSEFEQPKSLVQTEISKLSGDKPSKNTPSSHYVSGLFIKELIPNDIDSAFSKAKVDTRNYKNSNKVLPARVCKRTCFLGPSSS
jgi:membrane peptidoglycan carboxypeptidase